jgi:hypothetical protein
MRLAVHVGAAINIVATLAACKGLVLVGCPIFGVWSAPAQTHRFSTSRATEVIVSAEGACRLVYY